MRRALLAALAVTVPLALLGAACGSDDDVSSSTSPAPSSSDSVHHDATVVTIEGVDYAFNDVPTSVPAGTTLEFRNGAPAELHELVVFRLADGGTLAPRISAHYETATELSVFNLGDGDRQGAYTRADIGLRYTAGTSKWWVDAFVRNVSDATIKTSAMNAFGPWVAQYVPPRTIGINTGVDF